MPARRTVTMTEAQPVSLSEYGETKISLTFAQERQLRTLVEHRLTIVPDVGVDRWTIKATSYVGTVVLPDLKILVTPKVTTANLFHLLEAGGRALDIGAEQFEYDSSKDLLPAFATFYVRHLERALGLGIPRAYVEFDDRLNNIRGRVDLPAQRRSAGLPLPISCRFDEYTADIPLNRILRAAATRLRRVAGVTITTRQALVGLLARLSEVGALRGPDLSAPVVFTRLNQHCRPAERLARMVLDGSTLRDAPGASGAGVFMVDMNQLFEEFVESRLRWYLRDRLIVHGQLSTRLDVGGAVGIRPDLAFSGPSGPMVYVGDVKYKVTTDGYARDRDYYQLLAYVTAMNLDEGLLGYCQDDGDPPPREIEVRHAGKRLRTWAIRLDGSPQDVETEMRRLADHIADRVRATAQPAVLRAAG